VFVKLLLKRLKEGENNFSEEDMVGSLFSAFISVGLKFDAIQAKFFAFSIW
jgi:hypothetical protein